MSEQTLCWRLKRLSIRVCKLFVVLLASVVKEAVFILVSLFNVLGLFMDIENQVHRAAFYLSDTDDFIYQCGHLQPGDACHVYCKCGGDGFDDVKYVCNACHSSIPKVRNILFHQMVSDYLDAAK